MKFRVLIAMLFVTCYLVSSQTIPVFQHVESEETPWLEDFETGTKPGYASGSVVCTMTKWTMDNALIGISGDDKKNGSQSVRMQTGGSLSFYALNGKADGIGRISIKYARFGTEPISTWKLQIKSTGVSTYFDVVEVVCTSTQLEEYSVLINQSGTVLIKIIHLSGGKINFDDIRITPYVEPAIASWTGNVDSNWQKAINWYGGNPGAGSHVIVPGGTPLLDFNTSVSYNDLTIRPGGRMKLMSAKTMTLTGNLNLECDSTGMASFINHGTINVAGQTRLQLELAGLKGTSERPWWYVAVPINNAKSDAFNLTDGVNKLSYYKENNLPAPTYIQIDDDSTELHPATGYVLYQGSRDSVFTFTGSLNTAAVTIYPTRTGYTAAKRGFNLIGNPYIAYLDWNKVERYNVRPTIWLRTRSRSGQMVFDTYDGVTGTSNGAAGRVTNLIPPCQAFWVKVDTDNSTGVLSLDRLVQSNDLPTNPLRTPSTDYATESEPPLLRLRLSKGTSYDETILVINPVANVGFDEYDSPKMSNNNPLVPEVFTFAAKEELVINHTGSLFKNQQIALGIRPGEEGVFMLSVDEMLHFSKSTKIYLIDKELNKEFPLNQGSNYAFQSDRSVSTDRFSVCRA